MDYEGKVVRSKNGTAKYRVVCRDWFGDYVLQSCRSRTRFLLVKPRHMEPNWKVVER